MKLRAVLAEDGGCDAELPVDNSSVVLITGGARGITAAAAVELAVQSRCRLILVGRSPRPSAEDIAVHAQARTLAELRAALIADGGFRDPKRIERECRRIMAAREIRGTLDAIERAGGSCEYHSLDVRDEVRFGALIDDLYARYGHIDGVIHGAGIIEDKLFLDKPLASFERVFDTKVSAARTLAAKLRSDTGFVVFFSSVSGAFGNRGQADYAAAGDALDKLALALQRKISGRVVSIDWGPWGETGMVSDTLAAAYASRGVGLIPLDEGVERLISELKCTDRSDPQVIYIAAEAAVAQDGRF